MFTRRTLLLAAGSVAGASLVSPLPLFAADGVHWHRIPSLGGHRVAKSRAEALRYFDALVPRMGYSPEALAYFRTAVKTLGVREEITNEQYRWMAFAKAGVRGVEPYVWLDARKVGKQYFAERWVYPMTGETLDLPEACDNWARPFAEHHCFEFALDFSGKPLAAYYWFDELEGASDTAVAAFWQKLLTSDCFHVRFVDGTRLKPADGCDICRPGWIFIGWPPSLPMERRQPAKRILTIPTDPSGQTRILSFPRWAAVHYATYCPEDHSEQGYVDPAVTRARLNAGAWDYGPVIVPDPLGR